MLGILRKGFCAVSLCLCPTLCLCSSLSLFSLFLISLSVSLSSPSFSLFLSLLFFSFFLSFSFSHFTVTLSNSSLSPSFLCVCRSLPLSFSLFGHLPPAPLSPSVDPSLVSSSPSVLPSSISPPQSNPLRPVMSVSMGHGAASCGHVPSALLLTSHSTVTQTKGHCDTDYHGPPTIAR